MTPPPFGGFGNKRLKYNTSKKKPEVDGHKFDSAIEAKFYEFMRDDPRFTIIELHPRYELQCKYETKDGRKIRAIDYVADFLIEVEGDRYIVDVKGQETGEFKIKRKIFERRYPDDILLVLKSLKDLRLAVL